MTKRFLIILSLLLFPAISFAQLVSVSSFGSNPGNLAMFRYSPAGVPSNAPLVVVLHGCTQTATAYANETEWNKLANTYGFHVVYPEQKTGNNSSRCFNWFENGDITRGQGEALSIKQMVDFMKNNFSIDNSRVFVTGLSAGGAMTTVMCATYPEVFTAGAPMAGLPYRAGVGITAAFQAMSPGVDRTPQQWGDLVRQQFPSFSGIYPKMVVFHGSQDFTVRPMNMIEIAEQWTNVNGANATIDITNTNFDGVNNITRRVYNDNSGNPVVITYEMIGMGHAITVNPGNTNPKQGGQTGGYSVNRGFWSSYWAADFFGLIAPAAPSTPPAAPSNLTATAVSASQINLTWADNSTDEANFVVERSTSATTGFSTIATLAANTTAYNSTGLNSSTTYYYRVRATNTGGNSSFSNTANATTQQSTVNAPAAPSNLTATAVSASQINLTWADNSTDEANFVVERSTSATTDFSTIATLASNTTAYNSTGINSSTTYYYRVRAINAGGNSAYSNTASATTQQAQVSSYTIAQTTGNFYLSVLNNVNTGQSITTVGAGQITQVKFRLYSAINNSTLRIYVGNTVLGTPAYSQSVSTSAGGWQTFTLSTPFAVNANTQYTIILTNASVAYRAANVYSGGHLWYNTIAYTVFDAAFEVIIEENNNKSALFETNSQEEVSIKLYPNPCTDWLIAEHSQPTSFVVSVYDAMGRKVVQDETAKHKLKIEVKHLPRGVYYLLLKDEHKIHTKQFVIE